MNLFTSQQNCAFLKIVPVSKLAYFVFLYQQRQVNEGRFEVLILMLQLWPLTQPLIYAIYALQTRCTAINGSLT